MKLGSVYPRGYIEPRLNIPRYVGPRLIIPGGILEGGGGYVSELLINFSRNGEQARIPPITMNGEQIERTDSAKILGVTISADLTWNAHVNNTVSKASKRLYMLYQLTSTYPY